MHYVYILNIDKRLIEHNRGDGAYSRTYAPWKLEVYVAFKNRELADNFEHYLPKLASTQPL